MEDRHHLPFEILEAGWITLEEYLTQPGTPGSLALERMQKDADRTHGEYIGGLPRKLNGNSKLWKEGREK
jgi:hypothetical protein